MGRRVARLALVVGALLVIVGVAAAGEGPAYPRKPITLIVPYPPGGVSDLTARPLAQEMHSLLPHPVVIVNRAGGGGTVGFAEAIQARPDGYTLAWGSVGISAIQPHLTDLPYKTPEDYKVVINVASSSEVFAIRGDGPWKSMQELVGYAKVNPGKVRVAIPGVGSIQQMLFESLKDLAGVEFVGVPFAGGGEAIPALLGGHVEGIVIAPAPLLGYITAGTARPLATFSEKRDVGSPDVPTMKELGYDIAKDEYLFVALPKATPDSIAQTLHDAFKKAMESESFKKFAREKGLVVKYEGATELRKRLASDYAFYGDLIKRKKLTLSK